MQPNWRTLAFGELSLDQLYDILRLRQEVFALEQNSIYLDLDGLDQGCRHMLCECDGKLLAYQRCLPPGLVYPDSAIGRIVVSPEARGRELGRELVRRGIEHNLQHWPGNDICINAQSYLRDFYQDFGFEVQGDEYDEDGIPHVKMLLRRSVA